VAGRYEEAIAALKKGLSTNPNYLYAHLNLAAAYSQSGREEEARAEVAEVLRIDPTCSLEGVRRIFTGKDQAVSERYLAAVRKAGLK
jgi:tetratricopeptide (TPR) repeat protein